VVGAVDVEVLVTKATVGADDERGADLANSGSRLVDVVAAPRCRKGGSPCARMQELEPAERRDGSGFGGLRVVVDEDHEWQTFIADERTCLSVSACSDRDDSTTELGNLVISIAQLRGALAAVQSTEVAQEHQNCLLLAPQVTEATGGTRAVGQRDGGEQGDIHARKCR
jgi:hypothetical protein